MKLPEGMGERLAELVKAYVAKELQPLRERIAELEARSRGAMAFKGVFQRALAYQRGDCVTSDGALWFCTRETTGEPKPGEATNSAWVLTGKNR